MKILLVALGWQDRAVTFDPVAFSLREAERLIFDFKDKYSL